LYVTSLTDNKPIEIQIRTSIHHNWATLVEITDLLYGVRVKEHGDHRELTRFHFLLSDIDQISIDRKKELVKLIKSHKYIETLSEVFGRNYIQVRKQWLETRKATHQYFLIEANKHSPPKISSYSNFKLAEENYFKVYRNNDKSNIVLTHLPNATYKQISLAYSNYILTYHTFIDDCYDIIEDLVLESLEDGNIRAFMRYLGMYYDIAYNYMRNLSSEIKEIEALSQKTIKAKRDLRQQDKEWLNDLRRQIESRKSKTDAFRQEFFTLVPDSRMWGFVTRMVIRYNIDNFNARVKRLNRELQTK